MRPKLLTAAVLATAAAVLALAPPAGAQQPAPQSPGVVRGTIAAVDGARVVVRTRDGQEVKATLSDRTTVTGLERISLADIAGNSFVGVAAVPQEGAGPGAPERAVSIHLFPEAMRGTGEGTRAYDLSTNASMTNGAVTQKVLEKAGNLLTITFAGGERKILVTPETSLVRFAPGTLAEVKAGAHVVVRGLKTEDGTLEVRRVLVGRDGVVPAL